LEQNREREPEGKMQKSSDLQCSSTYLIKNPLHPFALMQLSKPLGAPSIYKASHYPCNAVAVLAHGL